jgi:uncharacterized protein YqgV (UPF0045/DUF77 family)
MNKKSKVAVTTARSAKSAGESSRNDKKINAAIQLLPLAGKEDKYPLIDAAIALIKNSGLKYRVCPFETVVEGTSKEVYSLILNIQMQTLEKGCDELLLNIKIHAASRNLSFTDKTAKFD